MLMSHMGPTQKFHDFFILCLLCAEISVQKNFSFTKKVARKHEVYFEYFDRSVTLFLFDKIKTVSVCTTALIKTTLPCSQNTKFLF